MNTITGNTTCLFGLIPVEIADLILSYLDTKHLVSVAKTCRNLRSIAEPHLYGDVKCSPRFLRTIREQPHLANLVKRFSFTKHVLYIGEPSAVESRLFDETLQDVVTLIFERTGTDFSAVDMNWAAWKGTNNFEFLFLLLKLPNIEMLKIDFSFSNSIEYLLSFFMDRDPDVLGKLKEIRYNLKDLCSPSRGRTEYNILSNTRLPFSQHRPPSLEAVAIDCPLGELLGPGRWKWKVPNWTDRLELNSDESIINSAGEMDAAAPRLTHLQWTIDECCLINDPTWVHVDTGIGPTLRKAANLRYFSMRCAARKPSAAFSHMLGTVYGTASRSFIESLAHLEHLEELHVPVCTLFGWAPAKADEWVCAGWLPPSIKRLVLTTALKDGDAFPWSPSS